LFGNILKPLKVVENNNRYQAMFEKIWWPRLELGYGNNPEDDFVKWFTIEMGNPQPSP